MQLQNEHDLLSCLTTILGGRDGLSSPERKVLEGIPRLNKNDIDEIIAAVRADEDPLGEAFCSLRSATTRRNQGQIFTPAVIVRSMIARAALDADTNGTFAVIVDPGTGSGRFLREAAIAFPDAALVAVEADPLCALILRANLTILGLHDRAKVIVDDYRAIKKIPSVGRVLFIGNPPYVRHHDIGVQWKGWYAETTGSLGARGSKLAGLHIHFFIQTHLLSRNGDFALFVTSAEWMETQYGNALRRLLAGPLGGTSIHVVDANAAPFPGVMTTAAVTTFRPHTPSDTIRFCKVDTSAELEDLTAGHDIPSTQLIDLPRWSAEHHLPFPPPRVDGTRVGDLFRVSRGQVTGCNAVWIAGPHAKGLPTQFLMPCITAAKDIFVIAENGGRLTTVDHLKKVICLPQRLDQETLATREKIQTFLVRAQQMGADQSYIAQHRNPWWSVVLHQPAPIICTYMARRRPAFIRNDAGAGILNIAHGLYPKVPLTNEELDEICVALNAAVLLTDGRVYAGGLTKFEPKAVEGLVIGWQRGRNSMVAVV